MNVWLARIFMAQTQKARKRDIERNQGEMAVNSE